MSVGRGLHHIAGGIHTFVRDDAAPVQSLDDIFLGSGYEPVRVRVLDPDDEIATVLLVLVVVIYRFPYSYNV